MPGIVLDKVTFGYEKTKPILQNLSLEIKPGSLVGLAGSNGSGKSTFVQLLNGIIPHHTSGHLQGEVLIDGTSTKTHNIAYFAARVGIVFQNPDFSLFNLTVQEEVEFGLKNLKLDKIGQRVDRALEIVRLSHKKQVNPQELSMGQKQRVVLACVLALDTPYLVLDEPSAMLDYRSSLEIYQFLTELNQAGKTIITIEHDTDWLWQFCEEIIVLDQGQIALQGPKTRVFSQTETIRELGIKQPNMNVNV